MKFYDIDVLAKKYGGGNKYLATSLIAESACRLSEKRNSGGNETEKEKYLSEVLSRFDSGVDIEKLIQEDVSQENASQENVSQENVSQENVSQEDVPNDGLFLQNELIIKAVDE